jgi:hypothetical protein
MLARGGLRAQLVLRGQRELYDYWRAVGGPRAVPARSDFDPCRIPKLLPNIALIEIASNLAQARFRLAGTALHAVYDAEVTGRPLDQVFSGRCGRYWRRVHRIVIDKGQALHGVVRGPAKERDHVVLFWLRLPLADEAGGTRFILCYDVPAPVSDLARVDLAEYADAPLCGPRFRPLPIRAWG